MLSGFKNISSEEKANVISHSLGFIFFAILLPFLLVKAFQYSTISAGIGMSIFGATLLFMLFSSTLYHYQSKPSIKELFRIFDHISIYLLIGGSYTAFILTYYNERGGLILLAIQWSIIALGILAKVFFTGKFEKLSTISYVLLGWMVLFIYGPISENISSSSMNWLLGGGFAYTFGVGFYVWNKLPFNHLIWHIFVLAGAFGHYYALFSGV